MDYENAAIQDIGAWYNLFRNDSVGTQQTQDVKPSVTNALGELLIYSTQAIAYTNFINGTVSSIEQDIKGDIMYDIGFPNTARQETTAAPVVKPQPLAMAVENRQKLVEYSEKLAAVIKSIDSILARVKIKEEV